MNDKELLGLEEPEKPNFFISLADLMSAAALVILLFTLFAFVQALDAAATNQLIYEEVIGIKAKIIERISNTMNQELGFERNQENAAVTINKEDLTLRIREDIFFDSGESTLKKSAGQPLNGLIKAFTKVLEDDELRNYISVILIEGHCDTTGSAELNWRLSTERALNVVQYLHDKSDILRVKYPSYFGAAGYSKFRPINENVLSLNRRIEIRVILKDDALLKQINRFLKREK
jgi:outer membrane protein OmpA-like peptidoglycan-associated protein